MTFLPIVDRELRVASRRRSTYWMRMGGAIGAMAFGNWIMLVMYELPPQYMGKSLFSTLSVITFIYAVITGARLTSDCLSEEKREGTLGLLFLTDLKGYDIVFGKLAANSIGSFYVILASFPVLAISLLLGGVTYGEFGRVVLVSMNLLFLALSIGMFTSAVCRDERTAMGLSFLLLIIIGFTTPLIGLLTYYENMQKFNTNFLVPSPVYSCVLAFDPIYQSKSEDFWKSSALTHIYGWICLVLSCWIVPRSWQDKSLSKKQLARRQKLFEITQGNSDARKQFRTRLLDKNPFLWLVARNRMKGRMVWFFLLGVAAVWIWGWWKLKEDWLEGSTYVLTALIVHTVIKIWVAGEAARRFVEDRRSGALELMLSTPITVKEIVRGQQRGLIRQFLGPVICILGVDFLMMLAEISPPTTESEIEWMLVWFAGMAIFVFDLIALAWISMWLGLKSQKVNRAAGGAVARIMFLPWGLFAGSFMLLAILSIFFKSGIFFRHLSEGSPIVYWFILSAANNAFWITYARSRFLQNFRELATQRFDASKSFWGFLKNPPVIPGR